MLHRARTLAVRPQLPLYPSAAVVLLGDLLGIVLLVAVGLYSHGTPAWVFPRHAVVTATPFLLAWLLLAPLFGLYNRRALRGYCRTLALLVPGWAAVALLAVVIRGTSLFPGGASRIFALVMTAVGLLVLLPWRLGVVAALRRGVPSFGR